MTALVIPGPSQLYVQWSCRRCGHTGGIARTTIPVTPEWNEAMMRELLSTLRRKLVRKHLLQACFATVDDFDFAAFVPQGQTLLDRV
jgi:hypothetical protein